MIFKRETLSFCILDVLKLKQKNIKAFNSKRNFGALSLRIHANTYLKTKTDEYHLKDNFVTYFPPGLDYERIAEVDELIVIHFDIMDYNTRSIEFFESSSPERLIKLFTDILACWNKKEIGYQLRCSAILYEIFAECYSQNFDNKKNSKVQNSVDYIYKNYTRSDITISEIARLSNISEVYFRKLFKEEYNVSPQKFIVNLRIQHASALILTGYYSLKEVAYMSGYNDYKYFSVEFKKINGVSPSEYSYNYHK